VDGVYRGPVRDVVVERRGHLLGEAAGHAWLVVGVLVGSGGLAARLGLTRWLERCFVPVEHGLELTEDGRLLALPPT
jgi:hypothetical protein